MLFTLAEAKKEQDGTAGDKETISEKM